MIKPAVEYERSGKLGNLDQLASGIRSTVEDGRAHGCRAVDVRVAGGIDVRILPDRGFDVGQAWYRGVPLAWISPARRGATPSGEGWLRRVDSATWGLRPRATVSTAASPTCGRPTCGLIE